MPDAATTNPTLDWLGDVVVDMGQWLVQQGTAVLESALAVTQVGAGKHMHIWVPHPGQMAALRDGVRSKCSLHA